MSDKLDLILEALNGINKRLESVENGQQALKDEINRRFNEVDKRFAAVDERFDSVDKQLADIRRFVDRTNIASTAGDEKLLQMITEIRDNMATKDEIREAQERMDAQTLLIARTQERVEMMRMKEAKKQ
jgi:uncharacterized protein YoxC